MYLITDKGKLSRNGRAQSCGPKTWSLRTLKVGEAISYDVRTAKLQAFLFD